MCTHPSRSMQLHGSSTEERWPPIHPDISWVMQAGVYCSWLNVRTEFLFCNTNVRHEHVSCPMQETKKGIYPNSVPIELGYSKFLLCIQLLHIAIVIITYQANDLLHTVHGCHFLLCELALLALTSTLTLNQRLPV